LSILVIKEIAAPRAYLKASSMAMKTN